MRLVVLALLVSVTGCDRKPEKAPGPTPPPSEPPLCDPYIAMLEASATRAPDGFPDEAYVSPHPELAVVARSRPVPSADSAAANEAIERGVAAAPGEPPRAYVFARGDSSVADLRRRFGPHSQATELRLLVMKTPEEELAPHLALLPRTPADLRDQLPRYRSLESARAELERLSAPCTELIDALAIIDRAPLDALGPATAEALRTCKCKVDDLDGYVSFYMWLYLPYPRVGYVAVASDDLAAMEGRQSIAELAAGLAR